MPPRPQCMMCLYTMQVMRLLVGAPWATQLHMQAAVKDRPARRLYEQSSVCLAPECRPCVCVQRHLVQLQRRQSAGCGRPAGESKRKLDRVQLLKRAMLCSARQYPAALVLCRYVKQTCFGRQHLCLGLCTACMHRWPGVGRTRLGLSEECL